MGQGELGAQVLGGSRHPGAEPANGTTPAQHQVPEMTLNFAAFYRAAQNSPQSMLPLCLLFALASGIPNPPKIPANFTVSVALNVLGNGTMYYSSSAQLLRVDVFNPIPMFNVPDVPGINTTELFVANESFLITNGVCRSLNAPFPQLFEWVEDPATQYLGRWEVSGLLCNVWSLALPERSINLTLYAHGDDPVRLILQTPDTLTTGGAGSVYDFGRDLRKHIVDSEFKA